MIDPKKTKKFHEFVMSNGNIFKGMSSLKDPLTGVGQIIFTDGSLYVGSIRKGLPHGHGEKIWSDVNT